ncbi:MAG: hypothetical protein IPL61_12495 [Myxococcales bacterium]|nr:hypothetical protein [Myxococcales bacterium]
MVRPSSRSLAVLAALALCAGTAAADVPVPGNPWPWPTLKSWLEGAPVKADTAGKVVVHWFCKPKVEACKDDLARIYNMRETGTMVYVIAYIGGTARDAKKLDPVRGEVGAGAVAYGKPVIKLLKELGFGAMPVSIVVGTEGKVQLVTTTADLDQLDARDAKVAALVKGIHEFDTTQSGPTAPIKPGDKFDVGVEVKLATWLNWNNMVPEVFLTTLPPDLTCDAKMKRGADVTVDGKFLRAKFQCSSMVKGAYELRAALRFGYDAPNKATGVGEDNVSWKFVIKP